MSSCNGSSLLRALWCGPNDVPGFLRQAQDAKLEKPRSRTDSVSDMREERYLTHWPVSPVFAPSIRSRCYDLQSQVGADTTAMRADVALPTDATGDSSTCIGPLQSHFLPGKAPQEGAVAAMTHAQSQTAGVWEEREVEVVDACCQTIQQVASAAGGCHKTAQFKAAMDGLFKEMAKEAQEQSSKWESFKEKARAREVARQNLHLSTAEPEILAKAPALETLLKLKTNRAKAHWAKGEGVPPRSASRLASG